MGNQSIVIKVPSNSRAYVFGSVLISPTPNDFDLLVVYDKAQCKPDDAYEEHAALAHVVSETSGLKVHMILLTIGEEKDIQLVERINAVLLDEAFQGTIDEDKEICAAEGQAVMEVPVDLIPTIRNFIAKRKSA